MTKQAADIFSDFERIRERMEQAWRQVLGPPGSPRFGSPLIEPSVDVYETEAEVVVVVEIAGISEEEGGVGGDGRGLILRGGGSLSGPSRRGPAPPGRVKWGRGRGGIRAGPAADRPAEGAPPCQPPREV